MHLPTLLRTRFDHLRNQRGSRAALEARQLGKFRRLVAHARKHSPYYADWIQERGVDPDTATPADFPVLTKRDLMANFDRIVTDPAITRERVEEFLARSRDPFELLDGRYHVVHTSGSSGEVGLFLYSSKDWTRGITHALRLNGHAFRRRKIAYFAATGGHFAGVSFLTAAQRSFNRLFFDVETYEINSPVDATVERLNRFQPEVLIGYASSLRVLAEKQQQGALRIAPRVLQSSGEPVNPADRELIEAVFGQPLINVYMASEHIYMGISRSHDEGMALLEDDLIFELNEDHTVVTNLFNYTLPLIRYRMEDVLVPAPDPAARDPYTRVRSLVGRNEHMPLFTNRYGNEDFISPHIINELIVPGVRRFQLQLVDAESFRFKVVLESDLWPSRQREVLAAVDAELRRLLAQKEMQNVRFQVVEVEDLPVDARTGKFRLILPPSTRPPAITAGRGASPPAAPRWGGVPVRQRGPGPRVARVDPRRSIRP